MLIAHEIPFIRSFFPCGTCQHLTLDHHVKIVLVDSPNSYSKKKDCTVCEIRFLAYSYPKC